MAGKATEGNAPRTEPEGGASSSTGPLGHFTAASQGLPKDYLYNSQRPAKSEGEGSKGQGPVRSRVNRGKSSIPALPLTHEDPPKQRKNTTSMSPKREARSPTCPKPENNKQDSNDGQSMTDHSYALRFGVKPTNPG